MTVAVTNPVHPLHGQVLMVRHITVVHGVRVVLTEHPDGGTLTLPGSMLNPPLPRAGTLFDVGRLVAIASKICMMKEVK
jgi:hypothetical protein